MTTPHHLLRTIGVLSLGLALGVGCTTRNPYNPGDGAALPDSGGYTDSGVRRDSQAQRDSGWQADGALPPDGVSSSCSDDSQCGAKQYCAFPVGSCGGAPGTCTPRPGPACPEYYAPVCGCDGKTYDNGCFAASVGVSLVHTGACKSNTSCNQLNADYVAAVNKAKKCAPMLLVVQCQVKVDNALHCACPTYVEQANTKAITELKQIKQQFNAAGCTPYQCGMPCMAAKPGNCASGPTGGGSCQ